MNDSKNLPIIKKQFSSHSNQYLIKELQEQDLLLLQDYCDQCRLDGVMNNISIEAMKIGNWKIDKWWVVLDEKKQKIICAVGCHPFDVYEQSSWRIMFRMATLKEYRGKAGPMSKYQSHCFGWGHILPFQVEYCLSMNAKKIYFTTNCDSQSGDINSLKQDRICQLTFEKLGMAKLIDTQVIYGTMQNVWEVLISDSRTLDKLVPKV